MTSKPVHVIPSSKELSEKKLSPQNIERALYALHYDGLVVLENVVDHTHLDKLNTRMMEEASYLSSLGEKSPYNYHKGVFIVIALIIGNIQQDPPPVKEFFFRDIFLSHTPPICTSDIR
jgi:hypothetical protein